MRHYVNLSASPIYLDDMSNHDGPSGRASSFSVREGLKRGPLSTEEKDQIVSMWKEGRKCHHVAAAISRHFSTVRHVFNDCEGKPRSEGKALTKAQFNRGSDAVCLECSYGRLEFYTNGMGRVYEECPKCMWYRYVRVPFG